MKIHLIAVGGSVMHNLAIDLYQNGHFVTGSDDQIYNPSKKRLEQYGLLPEKMGWDPARITEDLDLVILGMHAREDNPELIKAKESGIPILSFPAFIYQQSREARRIVVAGSHGKTTVTSMIMHVLNFLDYDFDYLVGAQLDGFERMVRLSGAPYIIIEGDEYLSSKLDPRPKFLHYKPHLAVITGIAWDHINVFPTFENYIEQFSLFIDQLEPGGSLVWFEDDPELLKIMETKEPAFQSIPYTTPPFRTKDNRDYLIASSGEKIPLQVFGKHNMQNLHAARLICREIGITEHEFHRAIQEFKGAARRLQLVREQEDSAVYLDFAHAPSKVKATVNAVRSLYPERYLVACLELHTFSSLNETFLPQYRHALHEADQAIVYYSAHTLQSKKMVPIDLKKLAAYFDHPNLRVIQTPEVLQKTLENTDWSNKNLLMMSSGRFDGVEF